MKKLFIIIGIMVGLGIGSYIMYTNLAKETVYTDEEIAMSYAYDKYNDDKSEIVLDKYDYTNDMLHFYIYRDGTVVNAVILNRTYWSDKLNNGYTYRE